MRHQQSPAATRYVAISMIAIVASAAEADTAKTSEIATHHFASINKGDLEGILSDYAAEAFMITPSGVVKGREAIRRVYAGMTSNGQKGVEMNVTSQLVEGDVAYAVWSQDSGKRRSAATLVIKDGKIVSQTVVVGLMPTPAPAQ